MIIQTIKTINGNEFTIKSKTSLELKQICFSVNQKFNQEIRPVHIKKITTLK